MNSKKYIFVALGCVFVFLFGGCSSKGNAEKESSQEKVDYSMYDFAGVQWTRDAECDTETLCFEENGEFRYSCACGNPVNDADMVESYTYDDETKVFTLNCYEDVEGMITEIKLISCDGEKLELDFDGEVREFVVEGTNSSEIDNVDKDSKYTNEEISQIYREVLKSERSFISVEEGNKDILLKDYNYYQGTYEENLLKIMFGFKDINDDGNSEVIVSLTTSENYPGNYEKLILYYEDGEVYGYRLPDWIHFDGDKVLGWIEVIWEGSKSVGVYEGQILVEIKDKRLNLTYIFEQEGSEEEKWLIENNRIKDEDKIIYMGDEYDAYISPSNKYEERYEFNDINIERHVR